MKKLLLMLTLALVALAGCKKETTEPVPEQEEFAITPAKDSEWAGGAIQINANRKIASWSHEMVIPEVGDKANYSESSSLSTSISESGLVTLGMYLKRFAAKIFAPTTMTLRITATSVDGETATCEVASMGWEAWFYLCSDEEVHNPEKVAVGDIVCLKFGDPSHAITDEEFLKNVEVSADNGQVKLTPVKREGNHFQYKVEKTTGGKITLQLGIKASYGAYTEDVYSVSVSEPGGLMSPAANCYIVTKAATYSFKTVKGNSSESVGSVASAKVLWETFGTDVTPAVGDLVKNVSYKDGVITFTATDKKGNAVIAAKDASGKILWSWHIWLTNQPNEHVYKENAGTMMDRNLGATSAIPGHVATLGLLYQWGRKDPFLGSSSISTSIEAKSTITWPSAVETSSSVGTVDFVTSNPTTFLESQDEPYDWHYSYRDDNLWTTSNRSKSIYDPCPAGWRVPDNDVWIKPFKWDHFGDIGAEGPLYMRFSYDNTNKGIYIPFSDPSPWYPAAVEWYSSDSCVEFYGDYWSASPVGDKALALSISWNGNAFPETERSRYKLSSVRCMKD